MDPADVLMTVLTVLTMHRPETVHINRESTMVPAAACKAMAGQSNNKTETFFIGGFSTYTIVGCIPLETPKKK